MTESLDLAKKGKGILLCFAIAVVAWICGQHAEVVGGPVFGILLGMLLAQALHGRDASSLQPGVKFTSKYILQAAVVFLGLGLNLAQVAKVGATSLPVILSTISTSLIVSFVMCRESLRSVR